MAESRNRLGQLIRQGSKQCKTCEEFETFLVENNVVALPCRLGDSTWYISTENPHVAFEPELKARKIPKPIAGILVTGDGICVATDYAEEVIDMCSKVGENYGYLSEADAEAEIARLKKLWMEGA